MTWSRPQIWPRGCFAQGRFARGCFVGCCLGLLIGSGEWLAGSSAHARQTIYVRLLVDEEEVAPDAGWKERLRGRLERATEILANYTSVRFAILDCATWQSDNQLGDFNASLREFESEVETGAAQVAIGFTSQYQLTGGRERLGGTRGALHSHILVREGNPRIYEPDRLEVLVHELGHFLGAAHSSDPDSIMRPAVADGRAHGQAYRIRFDAPNAEIVRLVGLEIRDRGVRKFTDLSPRTQDRLRVQYAKIAATFPEDATAQRYLRILDTTRHRTPLGPGGPRTMEPGLLGAGQGKLLPPPLPTPRPGLPNREGIPPAVAPR